MPCSKRVVLALGSFEKSGQAVFLSQRLEPFGTAGEELVRVALVSDIPDDSVARRIEDRV